MTKHIARKDKIGKEQLLIDHLTGVADRAAKFSAGRGWEQWARAAGLLHDAGKYSPAFQKYILEVTSPEGKKSKRRGPDHSTAGARVAVEELYGKEIGWLMAYAIAGHHAGLSNGSDGKHEGPSLKSRVNVKPLENDLDYSEFPRELLDGIKLDLMRDLPLQLKNLKDQLSTAYSLYFFVKFLYSCLVDADFLDTEEFMEPDLAKLRDLWPKLEELHDKFFTSIEENFSEDNPSVLNRERTEIRNQCLRAAEKSVGLFSLTVPTGGGKTLSSLAFALEHAQRHGLDRIIYVIPYTSIIEQNAEEFRKFLGNKAVLEHHSNFDPEKKYDEDKDDIEQWKKATENWDAPLVVTTNVQFFESLFHHRSSRNRKLHNMMDAVIILDEAQMIPTEYLLPSITALRVLSEQYNSSVVLCTATQPALEKSEDFPHGLEGVREIMENPKELFEKKVFRRVKVEIEENPLTVDELAEEMREKNRVLTVVNTRKQAREIFEALGEGKGNFHLSALMCPAHRLQIINDEIKTRLDPKDDMICRVVSTQLIEAGVDIDFPVVYRAETGLDSIAQAAGRCNREGKLTEPGRVIVFRLDEKKGSGPSHLQQRVEAAEDIFRKLNGGDPLAPDIVKSYFRELFWKNGEEGLDKLEIGKQLLAMGRKLYIPFRDIGEKFRFIKDDTRSIIIPWGEEGAELVKELRDPSYDFGILRRLQRFTVSVRERHYRELCDAGAVEILHDRFNVLQTKTPKDFYDEKLGLANEPDILYNSDKITV